MMKNIIATGKRKSAIARASLTTGKGNVFINNTPLDSYQPELAKLRIQEPIILAGSSMSKVDVTVSVKGGGFMAQTSAARLAIGKALVEKFPKLKEEFLQYDRQLLVADIRRKESSKPNSHGAARSKRQKSYR